MDWISGCICFSLLVISTVWLLGTLSWATYIFITLLVTFYIYSIYPYTVFHTDGIPGPVPWPVVGNMWSIYSKGVMMADADNIKKYGRVVGTYEGRTPVLLVTDQDMLKQILIKEFYYFQNRRGGNMEYPMRRSLVSLRGLEWRTVRSQLSPCFSASKLSHLIPRVTVSCKILCENLRYISTQNKVMDITKYCRAFAMDSIAATSFGLSLDSQNSKSDPFVIYADKIFNFRPSILVSIIMLLFPSTYRFLQKLNFELFPKDSAEFFVRVLNDAIKQRSTNDKIQDDLLQMMLNNHHRGQNLSAPEQANHTYTQLHKGLTKEEVLAQCILFLLAGYETSATSLTMATYCLATNMKYQQLLHDEISSVWNGKCLLSLDDLNKMKKLGCFIKETLRLYPPAVRVNRICSKDISINSYRIRQGTVIIIPIYSIQHDPLLWENPETFNPDRFSDSQKTHDSVKWLPFGSGPRHCVGVRMATMNLKIVLAHLISNFRFTQCSQTQVPLQFTKRGMLQSKDGVILSVEPR